MFSPALRRTAAEEQSQLLALAAGLGAVASLFAWIFGARIFPGILALLGCVAFAGWVAYRRIGHDVYLIFALIVLAIGRIVSPIIVFIMYVASIGLVGGALRVLGMNRLRRDFKACKQLPTMLVDASQPSNESFRRQS